eukprot:864993-Lingulodinium_polyedra.AAC.1
MLRARTLAWSRASARARPAASRRSGFCCVGRRANGAAQGAEVGPLLPGLNAVAAAARGAP